MEPLNHSDADAAIQLAAELLSQAIELQTSAERRQQAELDRMIDHDEDKATLVEMTDQAFRTHAPARVAEQLTHLLDIQGIPRFFNPVEQAMLQGFRAFGEYLPGVAVPLVKEKMRRETANVILPAEPKLLARHLSDRNKQGVQMNVNLLGEAILGEKEAKHRLEQVLKLLRIPEVECVSVKISTVYSQVSALAREHTIDVLTDRLESLYRTSLQEIHASTGSTKFIYLDMEEYRDLHLTADALIATLTRNDLRTVRAGIALQAYLPDSYATMRRLIDFSAQRVASGATPITIRLVKGANMEMERVEASIGGYVQAPYRTKRETDANFKRMLRELLVAAADEKVRVGVASHNLFDVALAIHWTDQLSSGSHVQFEMLEGMANHQRRAISKRDKPMLLYAPACQQQDFINAIGYLIRRLDENTGKQNFLRHSYRLKPESSEFLTLADDFRQAFEMADSVGDRPQRNQDRHVVTQPPAAEHWSQYIGEPDTDFSLPRHSVWAESIIQRWHPRCDEHAADIPLTIGGKTIEAPRFDSLDPSRPGTIIARYAKASPEQVLDAVKIARRDASGWRSISIDQRHATLRSVAQVLRERRADLIGAMIADGGKTISEADPEVSEAIDFCEFYPLSMADWLERKSIQTSPRGVVAVISPWNFPLAIPCGGIAASLAAGNTVILKPSGQTVLVAAALCQAFWDAGVPTDSLQLVPCDGRVAEKALVTNPEIDAVILTGSTLTARRMLEVRPDLHLLAETGGKNATIVTAMADRDLAIKHVIHSAFGHGGQKCSATSLLLLEDEVFHDHAFRDALADATSSLSIGSAWDLQTKMGPLICPPGADLTRGMKTLENKESWLVMPENVVGNPQLFRPGIKWNVSPGSYSHRTEFFGPLLSVMRFSRLTEAIEIVRSTGYGLTSGLESLDDREIELWRGSIPAGNLYINRSTTGAIVLRQPFGGVGLSAHGPGLKAGGPHYVLPLTRIVDGQHDGQAAETEAPLLSWAMAVAEQVTEYEDQQPITGQTIKTAIESQIAAVESEFGKEHDSLRLIGQDNLRRYRPLNGLTIRFTPSDSIRDFVLALSASTTVGSHTAISFDDHVDERLQTLLETSADRFPGLIHPVVETNDELTDRVRNGSVERLRLLHPIDPETELAKACAEAMVTIIAEPVVNDGRIECLRYMNEQSISHDYHRYGNLGRRGQTSHTI